MRPDQPRPFVQPGVPEALPATPGTQTQALIAIGIAVVVVAAIAAIRIQSGDAFERRPGIAASTTTLAPRSPEVARPEQAVARPLDLSASGLPSSRPPVSTSSERPAPAPTIAAPPPPPMQGPSIVARPPSAAAPTTTGGGLDLRRTGSPSHMPGTFMPPALRTGGQSVDLRQQGLPRGVTDINAPLIPPCLPTAPGVDLRRLGTPAEGAPK